MTSATRRTKTIILSLFIIVELLFVWFNFNPSNFTSFTRVLKIYNNKQARKGTAVFVAVCVSINRPSVNWYVLTLFRMLYDQLGFEQCQAHSLNAQTAHFHLCFVAFIILERAKMNTNQTGYQLRRNYRFHPENSSITFYLSSIYSLRKFYYYTTSNTSKK